MKAFFVCLNSSNDLLLRYWITNLSATYAKKFTVECIGWQRLCGTDAISNAFKISFLAFAYVLGSFVIVDTWMLSLQSGQATLDRVAEQLGKGTISRGLRKLL